VQSTHKTFALNTWGSVRKTR